MYTPTQNFSDIYYDSSPWWQYIKCFYFRWGCTLHSSYICLNFWFIIENNVFYILKSNKNCSAFKNLRGKKISKIVSASKILGGILHNLFFQNIIKLIYKKLRVSSNIFTHCSDHFEVLYVYVPNFFILFALIHWVFISIPGVIIWLIDTSGIVNFILISKIGYIYQSKRNFILSSMLFTS